MAQNDYSKGKLYKLVSDFTEQVYVGGTILELPARKSQHQSDYNRWIDDKPGSRYISSFEIIKLGGFRIELLENFPCNSRRELDERERYWIEHTPNCVNEVIPFRSAEEKRERTQKYKAENYILNKESILESRKDFYILHKESIRERAKEKITCDCCGAIISRCNKSHHERTQKHMEALEKLSSQCEAPSALREE